MDLNLVSGICIGFGGPFFIFVKNVGNGKLGFWVYNEHVSQYGKMNC